MSISLAELKEKNITDLAKIAKDLAIPGASGMRKQQEIYLALATENGNPASAEGPGGASAVAVVASHDGGATWVAVPKAPTQQVTTRLVLDPAAPAYLYGLTNDGPYRLSLTGTAGDLQLD